jgi:cytoskeleton protein RodZ
MKFENNLTLGQFLRQEREKKGITIEQVASSTKIGVKIIHALEGDHYSELPAKPFVRGFVISYARFIGLDYKEVLTHYSGFLEEKVHDRPTRDAGHSGYAFEKREGGDQSRTYLGLAMGGFVLLGGLAFLVLKPGLHHHHNSRLDKLREGHPSPEPEPSLLSSIVNLVSSPTPATSTAAPSPVAAAAGIAPMAAVAPTPTPTPTPTATAKPTPTATPTQSATPSPSPTAPDPLNSGVGLKASEIVQRVVFKAIESVWIRYKVDDKPVMQFIFKKDKTLVLRARTSILVQVGKPEDIQMSYRGTPFHLVSDDQNVATHNDDATLFFPPQLGEKIENPFPKTRPLSAKEVPISPTATPTPTAED